jgi:3-hydroxy-3-methylglutaryl CoA synthase
MTQEQADKDIRQALLKYSVNTGNSISGSNFSLLLEQLTDIKSKWMGDNVLPYLSNIGK